MKPSPPGPNPAGSGSPTSASLWTLQTLASVPLCSFMTALSLLPAWGSFYPEAQPDQVCALLTTAFPSAGN